MYKILFLKMINLNTLLKDDIDYKNSTLLKKFITVQGKILPRRFTNSNSKEYRSIVNSM